ncbi:hypothetical protein STENM327S_06143 [Streptomyces tendae]
MWRPEGTEHRGSFTLRSGSTGKWSPPRAAALVTEAAGPLTDGKNGRADSIRMEHSRRRAGAGGARLAGDAGICPASWDESARWEQWQAKERKRERNAEEFLLCRRREWAFPHPGGTPLRRSRDASRNSPDAVVRDGDPSVEVVIVRRASGGYRGIDGTWLGVHGEADDDEVTDRLMGGTVRLPPGLNDAARTELSPLPGWAGRPWLQYRLALVLEEDGTRLLGYGPGVVPRRARAGHRAGCEVKRLWSRGGTASPRAAVRLLLLERSTKREHPRSAGMAPAPRAVRRVPAVRRDDCDSRSSSPIFLDPLEVASI